MELKDRTSKIAFFEVTPAIDHLTDNEMLVLRHCVTAAALIDRIYLHQIYKSTFTLLNTLRSKSTVSQTERNKALIKFLEVNGGPWDIFRDFEPFAEHIPEKAKGSSFYPHDLTRTEWEMHLASNPGDREGFESPYTLIQRSSKGKLIAIPYSEAYGALLEGAEWELKAAAKLLTDGVLKKFLELRASAFKSNDYFESDMAWVDTDGSPFEVTIGPYEVYEDRLLGLKSTFEAFVGMPDEDSTAYLKRFAGVVPEFDLMLSERLGFTPKGAAIPLEVVRDIYRGGEVAYGRQFTAFNLPNDRRIHELKGSKKVFSRTMMESKFHTLHRPVAERLLHPSDLKYFKFNNRLLFVLGHELAHGLGPSKVKVNGREMSFETALRDLYPMFEEAKADMLGFVLLKHFQDKGLITAEDLIGCIITDIVSSPAGWRMSRGQAHNQGSLIQYNWFRDRGTVSYNSKTGFLEIDPEKTFSVIEELSYELLKIESEGDYDKAKAFAERWSSPAPEVEEICARLEDLPIEVHSVFNL